MSVEIPQDKILTLSKDFIQIPSVTGNTEAMDAVLDRASQELEGFSFEEFVEPNSGTRSLLFFNTAEQPASFRIILNGHLDVVSAKPEQFKPFVKGGRLYGRGASDMKAGLATELLVFKALASNLSYPIGLQIVTDEETGGFNGTGYQVAQGVRADMVISGESTELDINNERKGVLVLDLTTHGVPGHAAYLHRAENAVVKIARLVSELSERYPLPASEEDWITTLNIANIQTPNREHNKVPDVATALFDFRHIPQNSKESLIESIKAIAPVGTEIVVDRQGYAPYADPKHPDLVLLSDCIKNVLKNEPKFIRKAGSSDSRHFAEIGSVAIDFGPSGEGLHSDEEYGYIDSYNQYADILVQFLTALK